MTFCKDPLTRSAASAAILVLALSACTSGMTAAVESLRDVVRPQRAIDTAKLDPNFAYLRVTRGSHTGLLWRGSIEQSPEGPVEVYYSSTGEVVRLRDGRLIGALGLATEWRQVTISAPGWAAAARDSGSAPVVRVRDVMPGYRTGVRDELSLRVTAPPERTAMRGVEPNSVSWYEEAMRERGGFRLPGTGSDALPAARYAVDLSGVQATVVYSEQCLAPDLCFTWQRWSAAMQASIDGEKERSELRAVR